MDNKNSNLSKSLLDELNDINGLINSAMNKADDLEKQYINHFSDVFDKDNMPSSEVEESNLKNDPNISDGTKFSKPSNWNSLKDKALQDSIDSMEEDEFEAAKDTTKAREIKSRKKKLRIDDNWDDDPF